MIRQLDHLVIVVRNLNEAMADYRQLGLTVTPGGTHADGLTHNALVAFADGSYIELLAFVDPLQTGTHIWAHRLTQGEGIEDFALLSDAASTDASQWQAAGLPVQGPYDGGRMRPDGQQLEWRTVRFADERLPFVIEDRSPRTLRVPEGPATVHQFPVRGILGVSLVVHDLDTAVTRYRSLLTAGEIQDDRARFFLPDGIHYIDLLTDRVPVLGAAEHLTRFGEGIFAATLAGDQVLVLDEQLSHGAVLLVAQG